MHSQQIRWSDILNKARAIAKKNHSLLPSSALSRTEREHLQRSGFLERIIKGWYFLNNPSTDLSDQVAWQSVFWNFIKTYLNDKFGTQYCLCAECSLDLWAESNQIPSQVIAIVKKKTSYVVRLPQNTSLLIYQDILPENRVAFSNGLQIMPCASALVRSSPNYYKHSWSNINILLRTVPVHKISYAILQLPRPTTFNCIVNAYRKIGDIASLNQLIADLKASGIKMNDNTEFLQNALSLSNGTFERTKLTSPYAERTRILWEKMRPVVVNHFPKPKNNPHFQTDFFSTMEASYTQDAYHSLSIEGYHVSPQLIENIREGNAIAGNERDAMAAKGYREAFKAVKQSIEKVFQGEDPITILNRDLQNWYHSLFNPMIQAHLLAPENLAGYRNGPVFIRFSRHVPPRATLVPELMETYLSLLKNETSTATRAVLGHFFFGFIHPYFDGNGRISRFILNFFLAAGNYHWMVIPVENRTAYMHALEKASVEEDITDFVTFLQESTLNNLF